MATISVKSSLLRWALDRSSKSIQDLEAKFPKIRDWIQGKESPTLRQLEGFAHATATPLGFLFLEAPPVETLPMPHYRTIKDSAVRRPSPDLLDTVHIMERRQAWMREFFVAEGNTPLRFVKSAAIKESSALVADKMRNALGFDPNWASSRKSWTEALAALRNAMENAGIMVSISGVVGLNNKRKLDIEEFRGFVIVDDYAPLVFVNGADAKAAQMFTLAHELAHVFFGLSAAFDLSQLSPASAEEEKACNRAAAEFLVPEKILRAVWLMSKNYADQFQWLAKKFKVSSIVAARRALDLGLISKDEFLAFYKEYLAEEHRKSEDSESGGNFHLTQAVRLGTLFSSTIVRAVKEGRILYADAYSLTGMHGRTFETYMEQFL